MAPTWEPIPVTPLEVSDKSIVTRFSRMEESKCLILIRAMELVKCHSALVCWAFRSSSQMAIQR
jgi:hypothetical protein